MILTLTLPISFGAQLGSPTARQSFGGRSRSAGRVVDSDLATNLICASGQVNVAGSVRAQNAVTITGTCAITRTLVSTPLGHLLRSRRHQVYTDGQTWVGAGGSCAAGASSGSSKAICADGFEVTGHVTPTCGTGDQLVPAGGRRGGQSKPMRRRHRTAAGASVSTARRPSPTLDANAVATLQGTGGAACMRARSAEHRRRRRHGRHRPRPRPSRMPAALPLQAQLLRLPEHRASERRHLQRPDRDGDAADHALHLPDARLAQPGRHPAGDRHGMRPSPNRVTMPAPWANADFAQSRRQLSERALVLRRTIRAESPPRRSPRSRRTSTAKPR